MNLLPMAITAAGAIPSIIGGIMNAVLAGKKLSGGRLRHKRLRKRKGKGLIHKKRIHRKGKRNVKGKGVVADTLGSVPLLGALLGPLARAFGGKLKKMPKKHRRAAIVAMMRKLHGRGLSPMYIRRPYVSSGCGLSPMYIRRPYAGGRLTPLGASQAGAYLTPTMAQHAVSTMFPGTFPHYRFSEFPHSNFNLPTPAPSVFKPSIQESNLVPFIGPMNKPPMVVGPGTQGIASISASKGGMVHRKGHLRKIKGRKQKVRVRPALVGRGLLAPAGGYIPYKGHYGVYY